MPFPQEKIREAEARVCPPACLPSVDSRPDSRGSNELAAGASEVECECEIGMTGRCFVKV